MKKMLLFTLSSNLMACHAGDAQRMQQILMLAALNGGATHHEENDAYRGMAQAQKKSDKND